MDVEEEIRKIQERNRRVEGDKAWETNTARKILIFIFTYVAIAAYFFFMGLPDPWLNAVVPAVAFVLSTLTMPYFKKIWLKYVYRR